MITMRPYSPRRFGIIDFMGIVVAAAVAVGLSRYHLEQIPFAKSPGVATVRVTRSVVLSLSWLVVALSSVGPEARSTSAQAGWGCGLHRGPDCDRHRFLLLVPRCHLLPVDERLGEPALGVYPRADRRPDTFSHRRGVSLDRAGT